MWRIPALFMTEVVTLAAVYYSPHWYCATGSVLAMVGAALLMARGL